VGPVIIKQFRCGNLIEKNVLARRTLTLGTLVASGVAYFEALTYARYKRPRHVRKMYTKSRGDFARRSDAKAVKKNSVPFASIRGVLVLSLAEQSVLLCVSIEKEPRIVRRHFVNMVVRRRRDGELYTCLYTVADTYDEEVGRCYECLQSSLNRVLIIFLGGRRFHRERIVHSVGEAIE